MKKGVIVALVVVLVAAGAVAWSMSNKSKDEDTNASGNNNSSSQNESVATTSVDIKDMAFSPATITVKKGSTVTWTNKDGVSHTVTGDESGNMDSETLAEGDTYQFTFNEVGTFDYHCNFHSGMTGKVVVTE